MREDIYLQNSTIDVKLISAYRNALYKVQCSKDFILTIGNQCEDLLKLHVSFDVNCSAFITACNPYSEIVSAQDNENNQLKLIQEIQENGYIFFKGVGESSSGDWAGEPSVLVIGVNLDQAKFMGRKYKQNAIVWNGEDAIPQLILLR